MASEHRARLCSNLGQMIRCYRFAVWGEKVRGRWLRDDGSKIFVKVWKIGTDSAFVLSRTLKYSWVNRFMDKPIVFVIWILSKTQFLPFSMYNRFLAYYWIVLMCENSLLIDCWMHDSSVGACHCSWTTFHKLVYDLSVLMYVLVVLWCVKKRILDKNRKCGPGFVILNEKFRGWSHRIDHWSRQRNYYCFIFEWLCIACFSNININGFQVTHSLNLFKC